MTATWHINVNISVSVPGWTGGLVAWFVRVAVRGGGDGVTTIAACLRFYGMGGRENWALAAS